MSIPISLLFQHGPMLRTLGRICAIALQPNRRPHDNPKVFPEVRKRLKAPSERLIKHYSTWCGSPLQRYTGILPPHLFTQFALPVWAVQLQMTRYPLATIINRGCGMRVHDPIPAGQDLVVRASVNAVDESAHRARIHQRLAVGTDSCRHAWSVDFYSTFILGRRPSEKRGRPESHDLLEPVGHWHADRMDGFRFGILTGDLNPLHWCAPIARRAPLKGIVLHGFGVFARSFEALQTITGKRIHAIDVRFIRPVPLPSGKLTLMHGGSCNNDGNRTLVLHDASGDVVMTGHYR